jgi:hypothetical protein
MAPDSFRPRVYLDISLDGEPVGQLTIGLFADKAPKACDKYAA